MAADPDGESGGTPHTTISVKRETFQRIKHLKRDGETWDLFVNDLADNYEKMSGNINEAKIDLIMHRAEKATPTLEELHELREMVEKGETDLDEDDLEDLRKNLEKTRELEREVFG